MGAHRFLKMSFSRRSALAAAGVVMLPGAAVLVVSQAASAGFTLVWNEWGPLVGYRVSTECNPGGHTSFPCGQSDVAITTGSDLRSQLMAAGATYTYPLSIFGNFGYSGRVTLEASVTPGARAAASPAPATKGSKPFREVTT